MAVFINDTIKHLGSPFGGVTPFLATDLPFTDSSVSVCPTKVVLHHVNSFFMEFPPPPYWVHVIVGLAMTCIGIVAIVGNIFIMYIFIRFRSLRTPGNVLMPNLALADGLMAITGFPLYIVSSFKGRWVFGSNGCLIYGMCGAAFGLMSINTLAAIAIERYLVIVKSYPTASNTPKKHITALLIIVWVNSCGWAIAPALGWNRYALEGFGTTCSFDYITRSPSYRSLVMSMFTVGFFVPLTLIVYCYVYIIAFVRYSERHLSITSAMIDAQVWRGGRKFHRGTELKIARTVLLIVLFFCMSWLPYSVVALIGQFGDQTMLSPLASVVPGILAKMSTMYNPFIYCFSHPRIKVKVRLLFHLNERKGSANKDTTGKENRIYLNRLSLDKTGSCELNSATGWNSDKYEVTRNPSGNTTGYQSMRPSPHTSSDGPSLQAHKQELPTHDMNSMTSRCSNTTQPLHSTRTNGQGKRSEGEDDSYETSSSYHTCSSGAESRSDTSLSTYSVNDTVQCRRNEFTSCNSLVTNVAP